MIIIFDWQVKIMKRDSEIMNKNALIFFVYPDPKGSEENQFTPLGDGVNKLIFKQRRPRN
jgi:hypothetical protein